MKEFSHIKNELPIIPPKQINKMDKKLIEIN